MMKRIMLFLTLIALLVLVSGVLTMESTNYKLAWFTPLISSGGGKISSANYTANFTIGQSIIGASSSTNHESCLGYWCRPDEHRIYLPVTLKN
ncbi:MAG: hypothetical protein H6667_12395 [Ardenticatenaceae bacterium]|nr:hypothetical protein [Ardenticatenaceae bacterium]MCB9443567.1 hypothetical protein [Ardenticatenaceae bacterium]